MKKSAFTLIELSIVLVIIGLIVGGVLVGRDLIRAAEIRATVSQLEKYNTAVHSFRLKYGGIPGDLLYTQAAAMGLFSNSYAPYSSYPGYGDNNGLIQNGFGSATLTAATYLSGEPFMFWRQLSDAKLIDGNYGATLNAAAEASATTTEAVYGLIPRAKIGGSTIQANSPGDGKNYYVITNITSISGIGTNNASSNAMSARDAYAMDIKIDDGMPATGIVFAINALSGMNSYTTWTTLSAVSGCITSGAYTLNPGATLDCSLRVKFQ